MNPRQRKWQKSRRRKGERRYRAGVARACARADRMPATLGEMKAWIVRQLAAAGVR